MMGRASQASKAAFSSGPETAGKYKQDKSNSSATAPTELNMPF